MKDLKILDWVVLVAYSDTDGSVYRFTGTEDEVKDILVKLALADKTNDKEGYLEGPESPRDIESHILWELHGMALYTDYGVDYTAKLLEAIPALTNKLKATNIKWDTDGDKDVFDSLPTEIEVPEGMTDTEEISNYLSDQTGFCHYGFNLENETRV